MQNDLGRGSYRGPINETRSASRKGDRVGIKRLLVWNESKRLDLFVNRAAGNVSTHFAYCAGYRAAFDPVETGIA